MKKRFLEAGQVVNTHGLKGEVRIMPWCDSPEFLAQFTKLFYKNGEETAEVEKSRVNKSFVITKFKGIDDINAAMGLIKKVVYIDRETVSLPEGSYFEQDLVGLEVMDAGSGEKYGVIKEVGRTGYNDVYTVACEGKQDVLIPALHDVIVSVDIDGGKMLIRPLKGLFDE